MRKSVHTKRVKSNRWFSVHFRFIFLFSFSPSGEKSVAKPRLFLARELLCVILPERNENRAKYEIIYIPFFAIILNSFSQEKIINGEIKDAENKTYLQYANVGISNKNTGTSSSITNLIRN